MAIKKAAATTRKRTMGARSGRTTISRMSAEMDTPTAPPQAPSMRYTSMIRSQMDDPAQVPAAPTPMPEPEAEPMPAPEAPAPEAPSAPMAKIRSEYQPQACTNCAHIPMGANTVVSLLIAMVFTLSSLLVASAMVIDSQQFQIRAFNGGGAPSSVAHR